MNKSKTSNDKDPHLLVLGNLKRGMLFILSAPAGTGKTTLVHMLTHEYSCVIASISFTTRAPRIGEIDGIHYHFISEEAFLSRVEAGEFLEYVYLYGHYYGTSRLWVEEMLNKGKYIVLVIDTQGAKQLREKISVTTIFLAPPSLEELERRLILRKTEDAQNIEQRLLWAKQEMNAQQAYDYLIINDDLATAYQVLRSIFVAEEHRIR